jgi:hypothetical protein
MSRKVRCLDLRGRRLLPCFFVGLALSAWLNPAAMAAKRCDWHAEKALSGETTYRKCLDLAALNGTTVDLPQNVTRIAQDGFSFCPNAFKSLGGGVADILYLVDNSGSMGDGESGSKDINGETYNSCAGDPFDRRGDVVKQAIHLQSQLALKTSAGFIPFSSNNQIQDQVTAPLDISATSTLTPAHLQTLTKAISAAVGAGNGNDPCMDFRDQLGKVAALQKATATYWGKPLEKAIEWRKNDPYYKISNKPAIVLISDGAISDWAAVKKMIPSLPPVYGVHLGYRLNRDKKIDNASLYLDTLSRLTGGRFYRVAPNDTTTMHLVMAEIIRSVINTPLPQAVTVTNQSLAVPQVSIGANMRANPDSSVGVTLDSIIALKEGVNQIKIDLTLNDTTIRNYTVNLNVAGAAASRNAGNYTCYDLPTLSMLDANGKPPELYTGDATTYLVHLTRSPSELQDVTVIATSSDSTRSDAKTWGDREAIAMGLPNLALGYPVQEKSQPFTGRSDAPKPGNNKLESDQAGSVTLTWSHPRDGREIAIYTLPGKIIPVVPAVGELRPPKEPARGPETITGLQPTDAVMILSQAPTVAGGEPGPCVSGCEVIQHTGIAPKSIPTWTLPVNAPFDYEFQVFDNFGQFIHSGKGEFTQAQFDLVRKNTDTARVALSFVPVSQYGQHLATGAYIMRFRVHTLGETVTRNAVGDEVRVLSTHIEQTKRFGYIRQSR